MNTKIESQSSIEIIKFINFILEKDENIDIGDIYSFFSLINGHSENHINISNLIKLIKASSNIEDTIIKLYTHYRWEDTDIKSIIHNFNDIIKKYKVYKNFSNAQDWIKLYNPIYNFVNVDDEYFIAAYFNDNLKELYFKCLNSKFDLGKWKKKISKVDLVTVFEFLSKNDLLFNPKVPIINYLNWERIIDELRDFNIYIYNINNKVVFSDARI